MKSKEAQTILEELRKGVPPAGRLREFTVGRKEEMVRVLRHLESADDRALLLKANYGSGKTHLLRWIRENALAAGFAVSLVTLDSASGVRFNRMDQVAGAILRSLEVPLTGGTVGRLNEALEFFANKARLAEQWPEGISREFWAGVSSDWRWDYSARLNSAPFYIAFRAWNFAKSRETKDLILDWLRNPECYTSRRKEVYTSLIEDLHPNIRDPRSDKSLYANGDLVFNQNGYSHCWSALEDVHRMAMASGLRGLVVLFDEFEDVLTNLKSINHQEDAFRNLFRFVFGDRFSGNAPPFTGKTFYAVTPSFVDKCKDRLMEKDRRDFDYKQFGRLPMFEMSPLNSSALEDLLKAIIRVHETAFNYRIPPLRAAGLRAVMSKASRSAVQDRVRQAIKDAVRVLDRAIE